MLDLLEDKGGRNQHGRLTVTYQKKLFTHCAAESFAISTNILILINPIDILAPFLEFLPVAATGFRVLL